MGTPYYSYSVKELGLIGTIADSLAAPTVQRPNEFTPTNPSVVNTVNVAITPAAPTAGTINTTIQYAQSIASDSVAQFGTQSTPVVVTLLETLDDAGDLASYLIQPVPKFWFGNIRIIMNGLTDAQRTTITNLDIGSQISVTKTFPKSTPSTVTQLMALEGISHDISPDRHIVTLYTNPARIYTYFIVGGYTTTTTRTNLLTNPNFEVGTTDWVGRNAATIARSTAQSYVGTASLQITTSASNNNGATASPATTITVGNTYTLSAYVRTDTGTLTNCYALIIWQNGGVEVSRVTGTFTTVTTSWARITATGVAPVGALVAEISIVRNTSTAGLIWFADAILFESASSALPYFDGTYADTYTGYTLTSQAWSGTANASTSTANWGLTSSFVGSQLNDTTKGLG
jgi:hypothetical protein